MKENYKEISLLKIENLGTQCTVVVLKPSSEKMKTIHVTEREVELYVGSFILCYFNQYSMCVCFVYNMGGYLRFLKIIIIYEYIDK